MTPLTTQMAARAMPFSYFHSSIYNIIALPAARRPSSRPPSPLYLGLVDMVVRRQSAPRWRPARIQIRTDQIFLGLTRQ